MIASYGTGGQMAETCVTFGGFEAVHMGHQKVLDALRGTAQERSLDAVVLRIPKQKAQYLYTPCEQEGLIRRRIGDRSRPVMVEASDDLAAERLVREILVEQLGVRVVVVGETLQFGSDGEGDLQALLGWAQRYHFEVVVCPTVYHEGEAISSQSVRRALEVHDLQKVRALLGRPYSLCGTVVHGRARGRTVGMPTVNLEVGPRKLRPPSGVYASTAWFNGERYLGLTNIGTRPSVDTRSDITIETYLLDFSQDVYGQQELLELHHYIRPVMRFAGLQEVQQQVQRDLETARAFLRGTV